MSLFPPLGFRRQNLRFGVSLLLNSLVLLFVLDDVAAESIGWHPDVTLELGRGVDLRNQDVIKPIVATFHRSDGSASEQGQSSISARFVSHSADLAKSFSLNASVSAKNLTYEGDLGVEFLRTTQFSQNSVSFVYDCKRTGPNELREVQRPSAQFFEDVDELKKTRSGEALHRAIVDRFGSHFVTGVQQGVHVSILYSLNYESSFTANQASLSLGARYRAGVTSADFKAAIETEMRKQSSSLSLDYQFISQGVSRPPDFPVSARINNVDEFLTHIAKLEAFCREIELSNARPVRYSVEPIENLPGYLELLDGHIPSGPFVSDYERFLRTYSEFQNWEDLLHIWTGDIAKVHWLNQKGQEMLLDMRADVERHLKTLENVAKRHFETAAPLEISSDILNYRANLQRIPFPRIVILARRSGSENSHWGIGYVNAGDASLVDKLPFQRLEAFVGDNFRRITTPIVYDLEEYEAGFDNHPFEGWREIGASVFGSEIYRELKTKVSEGTLRIGMFSWGNGGDQTYPASSWQLKLENSADEIVDHMFYVDDRQDDLEGLGELSARVDLSIDPVIDDSTAHLGGVVTKSFVVQNHGPGAAFAVSIEMILPDGVQLISATGTQGSGSVDDGVLDYHIGGLSYGSQASLNFQFKPLVTGDIRWFQPARLSFARGLTEGGGTRQIEDNEAHLEWVAVNLPELRIQNLQRTVRLSWTGSGDAAQFEYRDHLDGDASPWLSLEGEVTQSNGTSTIELAPSLEQRFFRLQLD